MLKNKSNIVILILILVSSFFIYKWYFSVGYNDHKKAIEKLESKNDELRSEINSNNIIIGDLRISVDSLEYNVGKKILKIDSLNIEIDSLSQSISLTKDELERLRIEKVEKEKKIKDFEENYIPKKIDNLFESLKNKLN